MAEGQTLHGQDSGQVSQALKLRLIISLASGFHSDGSLSIANFQTEEGHYPSSGLHLTLLWMCLFFSRLLPTGTKLALGATSAGI